MNITDNNKNKIGFSAFHYNQKEIVYMPNRFQQAFFHAFPKLQEKSAVSNSTLNARTYYCSENKYVWHIAWFDTHITKKIGYKPSGKKLTGVDHKKRTIDIDIIDPELMQKYLKISKINARNDLKQQIKSMIRSKYGTPENRIMRRNIRKNIKSVLRFLDPRTS